MLDELARARELAANLIGASTDEIALVESTQHGLNIVADALPLRQGDNVIAADIDFIGTVLPFRLLRDRGISVRFVANRGGKIGVEDLEASFDDRTRASTPHPRSGGTILRRS